jgi:site-specific recombinase XerD
VLAEPRWTDQRPAPGACVVSADGLEPRPVTEASGWTSADHRVREETREAIARAVSANTTRAYTRQWAVFIAWCTAEERISLPATTETLTEFTACLCRAGYAGASVEQAIAAVRVAHRTAGFPGCPDTRAADLVLADHRHALARAGRRPKKAKVLSIDEVRLMLEGCDTATLRHCRAGATGW